MTRNRPDLRNVYTYIIIRCGANSRADLPDEADSCMRESAPKDAVATIFKNNCQKACIFQKFILPLSPILKPNITNTCQQY